MKLNPFKKAVDEQLRASEALAQVTGSPEDAELMKRLTRSSTSQKEDLILKPSENLQHTLKAPERINELKKQYVQWAQQHNLGGSEPEEWVEDTFEFSDRGAHAVGQLDLRSIRTMQWPARLFSIGGSLYVNALTNLEVPTLLEVQGSLYAHSATAIDLPLLQKVGGDFYASSARTADLPSLQEVGDTLYAHSTVSLNLPALKRVGEYIYAESASNLDLPQLKELGGMIETGKEATINWNLPEDKVVRL